MLLWNPTASPLVIQQPAQSPNTPSTRLSARDVKQIEAAGLRASCRFTLRTTAMGAAGKSHVTIVMQRPVTDAIELKEPDATSIVYVQGDHGWKIFPADAPTLKRTIRLEPVPY